MRGRGPILALCALCALCALLTAGGAVFAKPGAQDDARDKSFVAYLAGIELIDNAHALDNAAKAKQYRRLCSLTGLDGASAIKMIETYKSRPEAWQKIQESIIQILQSIK
jgi:hypothetical protein